MLRNAVVSLLLDIGYARMLTVKIVNSDKLQIKII